LFSMLSARGLSLLNLPDLSFNLSAAQSNPFHLQQNPTGRINLGTAENRVCEKEVSDKLEEFRLTPTGNRWLQRYAGIGGVRGTKECLISHFSSLLSSHPSINHSILLHSCTAAYDVIAHLVCDPQDFILTPSPFYARVRTDCGERSECRVKGVPLDMANPRLDITIFQKEFDEWDGKGSRVRAIVLMNPHNPLGNIYKKEEVMELCEWAMNKDLFIIYDEILAGVIYSEEERKNFPSILNLIPLLSKPELIVWMSSLSKDMGIPGVRTSLLITHSPSLLPSLVRLEALADVPAPDQLIVQHLLKDRDWVSSIFSTSRLRLSSHSQFLFQSLLSISIPSLPPMAGMTLMADFSKYLPTQSFEEEDSLHLRLVHAGLILTKGGPTHAPSPGWFRIAFGVPKEELELGVARIYNLLVPGRKVEGEIRYNQ
ncbi:hypothetical protein PENTCL1PPCAC_12375, partial [Pristionchus entomophagus]